MGALQRQHISRREKVGFKNVISDLFPLALSVTAWFWPQFAMTIMTAGSNTHTHTHTHISRFRGRP